MMRQTLAPQLPQTPPSLPLRLRPPRQHAPGPLARAPQLQDRSVDEWAELSRAAEWKARQRERLYLTDFLQSHAWRMHDVAVALDELGTP